MTRLRFHTVRSGDTASRAMAKSKKGKASWMSPNRMMTVSTTPPKNPEIRPRPKPNPLPIVTDRKLIISE